MKDVALVLAAGSGTRMQSETKKQFIVLDQKPILYYSLKAFEESGVEKIVIVTSKEDIDYCRKGIVERYHFSKVTEIVEGGAQRFHSVYRGLKAVGDCDNVLIHDAARPMITTELIEDIRSALREHKAVITAVPVKDTIKSSDPDGFVTGTPDRKALWQVQTPQAFRFDLIKAAYGYVIREGMEDVTDDGMALERYTHGSERIKLLEGSYENIKVTTPEDLLIATVFLGKRDKNQVDTKYK
ncbi:2-C-methyl-D-erythritol 4-phosphate cytidylyltransferase [Parasporobacterium paucivorans]|uniref:2-C-methyl-D-erythritol 4-phosphate cytidylyltransferase n=1 Tax=Parasporobacterium paucivorans DSM 15970 TaxID=1122934 RepID=A0A1M6KNE9_9FIRM|nr:2-C-methyl-D-erythritol 4-phosphate cytidylyltransferase [Parasporobacterium paucivorans]SHJ60432.1 2-C-methyl-D-erythritol 4-phosphate cytidylyltransferase [Parasporobacterium paucivorans DSM 15970]